MGKKGIKKKKRKQERMKTITILLTGYSDWFGRFIRVISRSGYSHASLSIDGTEERRKEGSVCIRMRVPESICHDIAEEIQ